MRPHLSLAFVGLLCGLALAACAPPPRPFEHNDSVPVAVFQPRVGNAEIAIGTPANMPSAMAERVAAALAIELQSYGILASIQPAQAPMKLAGATSTRDADAGIEIEIEWFLFSGKAIQGPVASKTRATVDDFAAGSDRLVSRIAQQAAPRVATLMGRPPNFEPRSPGQVAAGVSIPPAPPPDTAPGQTATPAARAAAPPQLKVAVGNVTGAPSDGNRQLFAGMRRALGSNKIVVVDSGGGDAFTVVGTVSLTPTDDRSGVLSVKWVLKDPSGREMGNIEQSNPVPLAATRGSWAGFGDIVAAAAVEGVLELLEKALSKSR